MVTKFVRLMALAFCVSWAGTAHAITVGLVPVGQASTGSGTFTALVNPITAALDLSTFDTLFTSGPLAGNMMFSGFNPVAGTGTVDLNPFSLTPDFGAISMVSASGTYALTAQVNGLTAFGGGAALLTLSGFGFTGGTDSISNIILGVDPFLGFATFSNVQVSLQGLGTVSPVPLPLPGMLLLSAVGLLGFGRLRKWSKS